MPELSHPIKKITAFLLLTLVFNTSFCIGQETETPEDNFFISIAPFSLIDFADGSSVRMSLERKILPRTTISVEGGFYTPAGNVFSYKTDPTGLLVKPCLKYYLKRDRMYDGNYIGLEYQYKQQSYTLEDSISINQSPAYTKNYAMKRYVNCVNVKYGEFSEVNDFLTMEWYAGIGIRFFNSKSDLTDNEYEGIIRSEENLNTSNTAHQVREIGVIRYVNVTLGLKIGITL